MRRELLVALVVVLAGCTVPTFGGSDHPESPTGGDAIGYENGYWYDDPVSVTTADGLNETEREAVVARTMARVERIRDREFEQTVPVSVVSRAEYRNTTGGETGESLRRFDNAKFEALFFVGEDRDSIAVQQSNRGESVLGY